jgi:hypothetical protein
MLEGQSERRRFRYLAQTATGMIGQKFWTTQLITFWQRSRLGLFAMHAHAELAALLWGPGVSLHLANLAQAPGRAKPLPFS